MGAGALARLVAGGQVTAVEVLDAHLARIEERNPEINAVVALDEPTARSAATAVDQAVADRLPLPPLAGVPVTVKEAFAAIGMATTAGMAEHRGAPATADAPAVGRLRQAGALILGKTNVPTQLADLHCANPLFGRTANPWDLTRSPGGSSGGSAAALAAGMAALELGSDLSGSIRIPASWCGVVGLRPSNRVISKRGHLPWPIDGLLEPPTSVVGPMARSVEDVSLAYGALTSPTSLLARPPDGVRLGLWLEAEGAPVDTETTAAVASAGRALAEAGADVELIEAPMDPASALELAWRLVDAEITHGLTPTQWADASAAGAWPAVTVSLHDHLHDQEARLRVTAAWQAVWARFDAVICPAVPVAAQPLDERTGFADRPLRVDGAVRPGRELASWSLLTSVGHLPSVTLPVGLGCRSGLPVGAQVVGPPGADAALLAVAATIDRVLRPPS